MPASSPPAAWPRHFIVLAGSALVLLLLYWAQAVLIPIALAVLFTFLLSPLVSALQRRGLKRVPAVAFVLVVSISLIGGVGWLLLYQVRSLVDAYPTYEHNIRQKIADFKSAERGGFIEKLQNIALRMGHELKSDAAMAQPAAPPPEKAYPVKVVDDSPLQLTRLWEVLARLLEPFATIGLAVVLLIFLLIRREDMRDRVISLIGHGRVTVTTKALDEAGQRISRYLLMQATINGSLGLAVCLGLLAIGVPYAPLWGFLAAALRYIPFVGIWIAAALPLGMSLLVAETWTMPLLVIALFVSLEVLCNMLLEPLLYGRGVGVSEAATLVMIAFWTWLWGPMGLVLATPLTVCLAVLGRYVPFLKFVDTLLSDQPALEPPISYYQRLVAKDQDEAADIAADHAAAHSLEETIDDLLVPALTFSRRDLETGKLTEEDQHFALRATRDIVEELAALHHRNGEAERSGGPAEGNGEQPSAVPVLCCPARDETDDVALAILRESLDPRRFDVSLASTALLASEFVALVEKTRPTVVCIAAIPPGGLAQTRLICLRLRQRLPDLKILVARWGLKGNLDKNRDQLLEAGADQVALTYAETHKQLVSIAQLAPSRQPNAADRRAAFAVAQA